MSSWIYLFFFYLTTQQSHTTHFPKSWLTNSDNMTGVNPFLLFLKVDLMVIIQAGDHFIDWNSLSFS